MPGTGVYQVASGRARALVQALRAHGAYRFSEPDSYRQRRSFPADPLTALQWGLPAVGATSLTPPTPTADSPLLAIIEDDVDISHPDVAGVGVSGPAGASGDPDALAHGTAVTSVASAPANGVGITGVWPGARTTVFVSDLSCSGTVDALYRAADASAWVVSMSYGFQAGACFSHYVATQRLYGYGTVLIAAAGNEFQEGTRRTGFRPPARTWSRSAR